MSFKQMGLRSLAIVLSLLMCDAPQYLAAQTTNNGAPQQSTQAAQNQVPDSQAVSATPAQAQNPAQPAQNQPPAASQSTIPDPAQAPLQPVPTNIPDENAAPNAPSAVQQDQTAQKPVTKTLSTPAVQTQTPVIPLGTATAQEGVTRGGLASKPAGTAIAPAKQRQVRSILIKLGLVAAGAAAIGTVVGLSRSTSSVPPGAPR
jgi:hypothetical protein